MMSPLFILSIAITLIIFPPVLHASYVIALKNGATFTTDLYWVEGSQIKFYIYGGVVGFEKNRVSSITETELPDRIESQPTLKSPIQTPSFKAEQDKETLAHFEKQDYLEKQRSLTAKIRLKTAAFREAKAENDPVRLKAERQQLLDLKSALSQLLQRVREAYGGRIPAWWHTGASPAASDH
jgi:hypothetical protein